MNLEELKGLNVANRVVDLERRVKAAKGPQPDFEATVTGYWVKIDSNYGGVVEYNGKQYVTKILGWTSIRPGTPVTLTGAGGIYYSSW